MDHNDTRCENCIIRQLNALKALDKDALKKISDSKITRTVKKGESLFEEGDKLNGVYCIRNGVSKLFKTSENGKDQIVRIASKGEVIGQRSVITEEHTNLSSIALKDMELCFIPKNEFSENINNSPEFTKALLLQIADDLKSADNTLVNMAQKSVKQRIAETILYLERKFGKDSQGYIALILSRDDIANVVGTAKEACIRTLSQLKKDKLIITQGKRIKIADTKGLNRVVQGF